MALLAIEEAVRAVVEHLSGNRAWLDLPAQPVDATPSDINLLSKVVFMIQGKRFGLSAAQKSDVWRRWKAGQSLHEIGRAFDKEHSSIRCLVSRHGGFVPAVRRRSLEGSFLVRRYVRLPKTWTERCRL
jgi:hypothetical protein